ncbi:MAG: FtsX-like permease family protein [Chloroflexota bacterium]
MFSRPIVKLAWRHARRRPLQSLFFVIGVAIGVAMIVAIDLANGSAQRAFELGTETVTGKATHQIFGGPSGLDQQVYTDLRSKTGYRLSAPVVEDYIVVPELDAQPMRLLGIDVFAEAPFRSYLGSSLNNLGPATSYLPDLMAQPDTVLLSTSVAERYGVTVQDTFNIKVGSSEKSLTVIGLLQPSDDLSRRSLDGLLITDIATAQEVLGKVGRVDRIDLILPDKTTEPARFESTLERVAANLPPSARIETSAARAGTVNEMTAAFRLNLTALSLLALVVGVFLIYNTVTFSVVQRRPVLGSLRSLGMTRHEIFTLILLEAGILGAIGTLVGLALGILLGRGAVQLVTQTVNDLFFVVAVREVGLPILTLLKGAACGVAAALFGAVIPAYEATSVPPAGAMKRSNVEERMERLMPWISTIAVVLLAIGVGLLIPEFHLIIAFIGLFAIILGSALLTPLLTLGFMRLVRFFAERNGGVIERMAPRYIMRALSRTSVAVAALMVAVSVIIGVGVMISSFRTTVELWLGEVLQADIYVSSPSRSQQGNTLNDEIIQQLADLPGIREYGTIRTVEVAAYLPTETNTQSIIAEDTIPIQLAVIKKDVIGEKRRYKEAVGDWRETWQSVEAGGIIINEPMAYRYDLGVGDTLDIQTDQGIQPFSIVGVSVSFDVNPQVFMSTQNYRQAWEDRETSAIAFFIEEGANLDDVAASIRSELAGKVELLVASNRGLRQNALDVFDRTFSITVALQLLATIVAFIGILSTLMSLQLERQREIGVLRSAGMTRRQLWRLSLFETGLIGTSAGLVAIPVGFVLALILIYIINLRSFGWTLEMQLSTQEFVEAFGVALVSALLAGIYPAWRMGLTQPADALRAE